MVPDGCLDDAPAGAMREMTRETDPRHAAPPTTVRSLNPPALRSVLASLYLTGFDPGLRHFHAGAH